MRPPIYEPMTTRMSSKGQVVIPRKAREALGVGEGTQFSVHVENGAVKLMPETSSKERSSAPLLAFARQVRSQYKSKLLTGKAREQFLSDYAAELDAKATKTRNKPRPFRGKKRP